MILSVGKSPLKTKRFRAIWVDKDGKERHTDFGAPNAFTYLDGADETVRQNYVKRHMGNPGERAKIVQLIPSPALFSMYLTWGTSRDINKNIRYLNSLMK
jgi:hypothetical protein